MTYKRKQGYRLKIVERHRVVKNIRNKILGDVVQGFRTWEVVIKSFGKFGYYGKKEADNEQR